MHVVVVGLSHHSSPVTVRTAGGDDLKVGFTAVGARWDATLTGPAEIAYTGEWSEPVLAGAERS